MTNRKVDEFMKISKNKKPLDKPFGTKISKISNDGIEFYWKKLEHTDGYEIYRGYSDQGPFELIKTIKNRRKGTYVDADFDRTKKAVYYTIKTFVVEDDGSVSHSDMIEPKMAKYEEDLKAEREVTYLYSDTQRKIRAIYGWGEATDTSWTSSNEEIAIVNDDGIITGVSTGDCVITCTDNATGLKTTSKVVVDRKACKPLGKITSRYSFDTVSRSWRNPNASETNEATILMVGDLMCGANQMTVQYSDDIGWCFNDSYRFVKDIFKDSDLAVANLETLLASGWPYMTDERYIENNNNCNVTSRYLDAVKYAGFDMLTLSNNHNCDGGVKALLETIEQVDKYKFVRTGAFLNDYETRYTILDVNGIKVGFVAYTTPSTGFNNKDKSWTKEEKNKHLNAFSYDVAKRDIESCKKAGAEYIIAYMHWGLKNFLNKSDAQVEDAQHIANAGADYIVGANPHVLQEYDIIKTDDNREVPCFYSTGNFQSVMNQIPENRDSVIVKIKLKKAEEGTVILDDNCYIPCHTYRQCKNCNWIPMALCGEYDPKLKKVYRLDYLKRIEKTIGDKIKTY